MPRSSHLASLLALCLTSAGAAAAQPARAPAPGAQSETGRPFIRNYRPAEVGGDSQNWAIVQDKRGVIYVGSTAGVLEFDGAEWRLIHTPSYDTVRSLAIDDSGRIFVGAYGEIGYLEADNTGQMQYVSLLGHVPQDARQFDDVWRTFVTGDGVFFQTEQRIFRWAHGEIRVWTPASRFNRSSLVDARLYVTLPESGLNVLDGDTFRALPGTASLGREVYPVVLRWDEKRLLIGTRSNGLFLYDGAALTPFPTEVDDIIKGRLYRGITLRDGTLALATTANGFAIIDRQGHRIVIVDRNHGLASNAVYYLMPDREGALWAAMETGVARVETPSPASFFGTADGYRSMFYLMSNGGRLYVAGGSGVDYLVPAASDRAAHLAPVPGINNQCWWFETMPEPGAPVAPMAVACSDGLYEIRGTTSVAINAPADSTYRSAVLLRSSVDPTRMWVGLFDGISSYRRAHGKWIDEGRIAGITDQVRTLAEDRDGSLWAGTAGSGVLHLTLPKIDPGSPRPPSTIERLSTDRGLPSGGIAVISIRGELYFVPAGASNELYVALLDRQTGKFVRDRALEGLGWDRLRPGFGLLEGPNGRVYANFGLGLLVLTRNPDGGWAIDRSTFSRFGRQPIPFAMTDPYGALWFGWRDDLVRYDLTQPAPATLPPSALLRRVLADQDRLLFGGAGSFNAPRLPSSVRTLRFAFASPTFSDESGAEYQTLLEGLDREWSPWSGDSRRDYTNVGFGSYRFRVRARNSASLAGDEAVYSFAILPPWYRTWWAYGGYVLLLALASREPIACNAAGCSRKSARGHNSQKRGSARKRQRRSRDPKATASATSKRSARSDARSRPRSTSKRSSTACTSA